jgi:hypothetical protein
MEEDQNNTPLTLAEARELDFEFGLTAETARELQAELDAARDQRDSDVADVEQELAEAKRERDAAIERAEAAEAAGKKSAAEVKKLTTPAKPRKLGEVADGKRPDGDLQFHIAAADQVEIAFSDGRHEVPGIAPVAVSGEAWKPHAFGLMLAKPVDIDGPDGGSSVSIAGYALLLDGKQAAWRARDVPLQVAPGQRVSIVDDIIF